MTSEISILFVICVLATLITVWHIDEGVISIMVDNFNGNRPDAPFAGDLRYLFQHGNARFSFGWTWFYLVGLFARHPLNPDTYYLMRVPAALAIFLSGVSVYYYIVRIVGRSSLAPFLGGLAIVVGAMWMLIYTARYDAPFLFGNAALVFALGVRGPLDKETAPALYPLAMAGALLACSVALTSHPNGVACIIGWCLLWAMSVKSLGRRGNLYVALVAVAGFFFCWKTLLVGRTIPEFIHDLRLVEDSGHNFNILHSIKEQWVASKDILTHGDPPYSADWSGVYFKALTIGVIVFTLQLIWQWRQVLNRPLHVLLVFNAVFMAMLSSKRYSYYGLLLPLVTALAIPAIARLYRAAPALVRRYCPAVYPQALLAIGGFVVMGHLLMSEARTNSLFYYLIEPHGAERQMMAGLKKDLQGRAVNLFSDLRMMPLFSFMDAKVYYDTVHGAGEDVNASLDDLGEFSFCNSIHWGLSCGLAKQNKNFVHHNLTLYRKFKLFGEDWSIYRWSEKDKPAQ